LAALNSNWQLGRLYQHQIISQPQACDFNLYASLSSFLVTSRQHQAAKSIAKKGLDIYQHNKKIDTSLLWNTLG
jgi:hypothetical protein